MFFIQEYFIYNSSKDKTQISKNQKFKYDFWDINLIYFYLIILF